MAKLTPLEKAELYASGSRRPGCRRAARDLARSTVDKIERVDAYPNYEGRTGASPREVKTLILNAAQNPKFQCLSPLAVIEEMEELVKNVTVYEFLKQEPTAGRLSQNKKFIRLVRESTSTSSRTSCARRWASSTSASTASCSALREPRFALDQEGEAAQPDHRRLEIPTRS